MKLIAGLGNPGKAYINTRHNIGFETINRLAETWSITLKTRRLKSKIGTGRIGAEQVVLAQPLTFMNLSGQAIRSLTDYYRLDVKDIIIICDDVNLTSGQIRIRPDGGHGGHNGLLSVINDLQTQNFARLRIGIDKVTQETDLSQYVLSVPGKTQQPLLEKGLDLAVAAVETWISKGITESMNNHN